MRVVSDKTGLNIDNYFVLGKTILKTKAYLSIKYSVNRGYCSELDLVFKTYQL